MNTGPTTTSAAVYQSGGMTTLTGTATVGYNATALSLYDISGGVLNANGGLLVGGNANNGNLGQGDGAMNIQGSAVVSVSGGSGLQIGQNADAATPSTSGSVTLSSGLLSVVGSITLGSGGGIGTLTRSGGSVTVLGGLVIGGDATIVLDATTANVATSFSGGLGRSSLGTLVVVPYTGNLASSEALSFGKSPTLVDGILGPWAVLEQSGTDSAGDYLKLSGNSLAVFSAYQNGFAGSSGTSIVYAGSGSCGMSGSNATIYAMKVNGTAALSGSQTLTLNSGGLILNGGLVSGGTLAFNATPLIFAGTTTAGTVASAVERAAGLMKFGPGTVVLNADNSQTLSGQIAVNAGAVNARNSGASGASGAWSSVAVSAGASLELQNNVSVGDVPVTLNGLGVGGEGLLCDVQNNNSLAGPIGLGSNSQINTVAGSLTLGGAIQGPQYTLTKSGSGSLALAGASGSAFPASENLAAGTLVTQNSASFGPGGGMVGVTVGSGATLQLENTGLRGRYLDVPGLPRGASRSLLQTAPRQDLPFPVSPAA